MAAAKYVPVRQVARDLSCSLETVRRIVRQNPALAVKIGREYRIDRERLILSLSQLAAPRNTTGRN